MIGLVRGDIAGINGNSVILDTGGVGYRVTVSGATLTEVLRIVGPITLFTYMHVREDSLELFGFTSDGERTVFETLLSTHGVGPSLALAILGTLGVAEVVRSVQEQDAQRFEVVPGVGKKTAARLVLELQGSLAASSISPSGSGGISGTPLLRSEVADALEALGYASDEIRLAVSALEGSESVEEGLRIALKNMRVR